MKKKSTDAAAQNKALLASICRQGPNAIVSDTIPMCWMHFFTNDDDEAFSEDDSDERWDKEQALSWMRRWKEQGYHYSGPGNEESEDGVYNGMFGTLQQVFLVNQNVLDEDEANLRYSVSGSDELPSEYMLNKVDQGLVVLPESFEPRLEDMDVDVYESQGSDSLPPGPSPDKIQSFFSADDEALIEATDTEKWTNEACDFAVLYLATQGWKVGPRLPGTCKDAWFAGRWGPTMYYLIERVLPRSSRDNHIVHREWANRPTLITANGTFTP